MSIIEIKKSNPIYKVIDDYLFEKYWEDDRTDITFVDMAAELDIEVSQLDSFGIRNSIFKLEEETLSFILLTRIIHV